MIPILSRLLAGTVTIFLLAHGAASATGADIEKTPEPKSMPLWTGGAPGAKGTTDADVPSVTVYLPKVNRTGAAVVVCPGGGYGGLAISYEGHDVARWLNTIGAAGIVLKYRHAPRYRHPYPLMDAQRALRLTRAHAKEWHIDVARVGILGFSAGGHLASTTGTQDAVDSGIKEAAQDPIDAQSCRPDFMVLVYPVISLTASYAHIGSRDNLVGKDAAPELARSLSSERRVTGKTPPTFLVHTSGDTGVPPENSVAFYLALRKAKVASEIHIFEKGRHGLGLGLKGDPYSAWPGLCARWLDIKHGKGKR